MLRLAKACLAQGSALLEEGNVGAAYAMLGLAAWLDPRNSQALYQAAKAASALGKRDKVTDYCERALQVDPSSDAVHELLMNTFMHGEHYFSVLTRIHGLLKPRTYIEIGVETGESIRLAAPGTLALGVDPAAKLSGALPPNVRLFALTSDDFFAQIDVRAELGGLGVELAFIDGMHHFEFALRDFMNLERLCAKGATILIHDCFPHDRRTAERERHAVFWSGDIWRLIVLLKKYRPDLSIHTIATPPTGLAIVRKLDPSSRFIAENLGRLCDEYLALDYSYLRKDRARRLNLFPNDWDRIRALFAPAPAGAAS